MSITLTQNELKEITGLTHHKRQIQWLRKQGFVVHRRPNGSPLVSRLHFEQMTGSQSAAETHHSPDFSSLLPNRS